MRFMEGINTPTRDMTSLVNLKKILVSKGNICRFQMTSRRPRVRALKKKAMMRIIEKIASVVITHYVMLAGKCTVYKSLRNKESFS